MARHLFGGGIADYVVKRDGSRRLYAGVGQVVAAYLAETGGSPIDDLLDVDDDPLAVLVADTSGRLPQFQGPDGVDALWLSWDGQPRQRITAAGGGGFDAAGDPVLLGLDAFDDAGAGGNVAVGKEARTGGGPGPVYSATAVGAFSSANDEESTALGSSAGTSSPGATAVGYAAQASGQQSIAAGYNANTDAGADNSIAVGRDSNASAPAAIALGYGANATLDDAIAIGAATLASGATSLAAGDAAQATGANSLAVGSSAASTFARSAAIGYNADDDRDDQLMLGSGQVVEIGGTPSRLAMRSPDGTRFVLTVSNAGAVVITATP